jgi:hypothetical protein
VETVSAFFPAGEIYQFTRLTANVSFYTKKNFSHKMLIIMERAGSEDSDYSIRSFITVFPWGFWDFSHKPANKGGKKTPKEVWGLKPAGS